MNWHYTEMAKILITTHKVFPYILNIAIPRESLMHTANLPAYPQRITALPRKGLGERIWDQMGKKKG